MSVARCTDSDDGKLPEAVENCLAAIARQHWDTEVDEHAFTPWGAMMEAMRGAYRYALSERDSSPEVGRQSNDQGPRSDEHHPRPPAAAGGTASGSPELDAERYRWLRDRANVYDGACPFVWDCDHNGDPLESVLAMLHGQKLDDALDRVMEIERRHTATEERKP